MSGNGETSVRAEIAGLQPHWEAVSGDGQHDGIPPEEVRAELQRVVDSPDFSASVRNRRALRMIVERALAEPAAKVAARDLATGIYGRGARFSSVKDPIVRVEMLRLRRDLAAYYGGPGAGNPLRLWIPKGGYRAVIRRAGEPMPDGSVPPGRNGVFALGVLRAALTEWAGCPEEAAKAWGQLLSQDPDVAANLEDKVSREFGDERVAQLVVEGVRRVAGRVG